jgi:hypothetical protein
MVIAGMSQGLIQRMLIANTKPYRNLIVHIELYDETSILSHPITTRWARSQLLWFFTLDRESPLTRLTKLKWQQKHRRT